MRTIISILEKPYYRNVNVLSPLILWDFETLISSDNFHLPGAGIKVPYPEKWLRPSKRINILIDLDLPSSLVHIAVIEDFCKLVS